MKADRRPFGRCDVEAAFFAADPHADLERCPTHPGELMCDILEEHFHATIAEAAGRMGISEGDLSAVLDCNAPVQAPLALEFARLTGGRADLFVSMQKAYDAWHARALIGFGPPER